MGDISIDIIKITEDLEDKHKLFLNKYGRKISLAIAEDEMVIQRTAAKLRLIAQVFKKLGIISSWKEVETSNPTGDFPQSVELSRAAGGRSLYLLNSRGDVVVADSIGLAVSDAIDAGIVLVGDPRKVKKIFHNVLYESFDWYNFSLFVLDAIHTVMYDKGDVIRDLFEEKFSGGGDG